MDLNVEFDRHYLSDEVQAFEEKCKNTETAEDLMTLASDYYEVFSGESMGWPLMKFMYNKYIGWALPSRETCELVIETWHQYPNSRLIDLGAGTGLFCKVFNYLGIPEDKLLAIDHPTISCFKSLKSKNFWPIHREDNYQVDPNDILFIAWGVSTLKNIINDYVEKGGQCAIILGEEGGNMTTDPEKFVEDSRWDIIIYKVPGPASLWSEELSINRRK